MTISARGTNVVLLRKSKLGIDCWVICRGSKLCEDPWRRRNRKGRQRVLCPHRQPKVHPQGDLLGPHRLPEVHLQSVSRCSHHQQKIGTISTTAQRKHAEKCITLVDRLQQVNSGWCGSCCAPQACTGARCIHASSEHPSQENSRSGRSGTHGNQFDGSRRRKQGHEIQLATANLHASKPTRSTKQHSTYDIRAKSQTI
ncbi:uncharacterized protein LOC129745270 isoform X1 [Uranotaenia lowii]|uniref:uncharacterized protein LOC129745270 isoform X1 n=1 Tax=Uranotaenia lowii TaxID=190385 RepID=UPI00247847DB|nr:uncharacterized protein LOC129745270 isoform X1 [Uranotaenia lowii]